MSEERSSSKDWVGDDFDSDVERSVVVDAGSSTTLCGIRLRCNLEIRDFERESCVRFDLMRDGGLFLPSDAGPCTQRESPARARPTP